MKKYIFITPEGWTYKPNCDSPDPDVLEMQIIGFGQGSTVEEALNDLMELNAGTSAGKAARNLSLRIESGHHRSLWFRERKTRIPLAS